MPDKKFIEYLEFNKRFSTHTLDAYRNDLEQFKQYLKQEYSKDDISSADYNQIKYWLMWMMENNISPRSIKRKISTLKSFFKYLLRNEIISQNPMNKILSPKTPAKLPVFVEKDKMKLLFDEVTFKPGFEGLRDKIALEILYATGIRVSELSGLKNQNVDIFNNTIKVLGKRNKERIIPFGNLLRESIVEYRKLRENLENKDQEFLLSKKGKKTTREQIYKIVNNYLSIVTTVEKKSPHVLRHTFATHMLDNGADLNAIKELLGHANLSATQVYTHNSIEKLKSIYKQAHPRA